MYIPAAFAETRHDALLEFVAAHPLGALVTASREGLYATHLPWLLDSVVDGSDVLHGHIARANPHARLLREGADALVIFTGPDAYVSPAWYPSKQLHGKVVPTWDYVAVHVYGTVRLLDDADKLLAHVTALTHRHEHKRENPWAVGDAPSEYIDRTLAAIVGLELRVTGIEGKWKASQNRSHDDITGVAMGLSSSGDARDAEMAAVVASANRPQ